MSTKPTCHQALPFFQAAKSALAAVASELADITPKLATCSASTTLVNTGTNLIMHCHPHGSCNGWAGRGLSHRQGVRSLTQVVAQEPLLGAVQDKVDIDANALIHEARESIMEVRKVRG